MGPLIAEDNRGPDVGHDITVLLSNWQMREDVSLVDEYVIHTV